MFLGKLTAQSDAARTKAALTKLIKEQEAQLSTSVEEQDKLKARRDEISSELSEMRVKGAEIGKDIQACRESIAQLEKTITDRHFWLIS